MLIDWFTVGAQIVNFLILVWLLKHFLYKPILDAIDAREKRIAAELADADAKKAEAEKERTDFEDKNKAFDQQRTALLGKATDEAKAERERLIDQAKKDAESLRVTQADALRGDQVRLGSEITLLAEKEVFAIARKALTDLATVSLEERVGEVFTRRLRELDPKAKQLLGDALKNSSQPALVRSAFELPPDQRAAIQNALNETFSAVVRIKFEDSQDAICGIELTANGQKVAWSISSYLGELSKKVSDLVDAQSLQAIKSEPKPEAAKAPKPEAAKEPEPETAKAPKPEAAKAPEPEAAKEPKSETAKAPEPETAKAPEPDTAKAPEPNTAKAPEPEAAKAPKPEPVALVEAK
jgi:F-type H+-transporting ATPase subunit b